MTPAKVDRYTCRRPLQPLDDRYDRYDRYTRLLTVWPAPDTGYGFTDLPPPYPSSRAPRGRAPANQVTAGYGKHILNKDTCSVNENEVRRESISKSPNHACVGDLTWSHGAPAHLASRS